MRLSQTFETGIGYVLIHISFYFRD